MSELEKSLLEAAKTLNLEAIEDLLKKGADASYIEDLEGVWGSRSKNGPLHFALRKRPYKSDEEVSSYQHQVDQWSSVVRLLIEAKSDVNAVSEEFDWRGCGHAESAFDLALPFVVHHSDFLDLFLKHGADCNSVRLHEVHSMRTDGRSQVPLLHEAVKEGQLEAVRALLDHGAKADAYSSQEFFNERGFNRHTEETALHIAAEALDLRMVRLLLERGGKVDAPRKRTEHVPTAPTARGADADAALLGSRVLCVPIEETALHIAIQKKHCDLVTLLICSGADVSRPRLRDGVQTSCEELCEKDDSLIKALKAMWSPETHHYFPSKVRESVKTALMISQRQKWPVPESVLFKVCAMFAGPETS